jgi:hypothetical protein
MLSGYSIQNTRYVLVALEAYEQRIQMGAARGAAEATASEVYKSLSGRSATSSTVRRWRRVVDSYGGLKKVPENAFGARRSCPHVPRPSRDLLRQIVKVVSRIGREVAEKADSRAVGELAVASQLLGEVFANGRHSPAERHLVTIKALATRLAGTPVHSLHRFTSAPEMEEALRAVLVRLKGIPAMGAETTI